MTNISECSKCTREILIKARKDHNKPYWLKKVTRGWVHCLACNDWTNMDAIISGG